MRTSKNILTDKEMELVSLLMRDCQSTGEIQTKLKRLFAGSIEQMLEAEMEEHLGYEKHSGEGDNTGNSRNGYNRKTIISDYGESEIAVPRDRKGEFEPKVLEKRQVRTDEIEQKILAMYAKGMSQRDIEDNLREIYGAEIPQTMISKITDKILPEVNEWQNRPLESIYPIIYFDGIVFKSRKDNQIVNKCVYSVLGIDMSGQKEIMGIWLSENEGASFWASVCSDLKKRGVMDVFIACHDNLKGLGEAINAVFPKTKQQLCIVHQIRNSIKFVYYRDRKEICADLKKIYGAVNLDDEEYAKEEFWEKWDKKYPSILRSWDANWAELTTFFNYPQEIRHLIYTTNAVEAYHRMVRKFTKAKAIFPTDSSLQFIDNQTTNMAYSYSPMYWDITSLAQDWYFGINNGLVLAAADESQENSVIYYSAIFDASLGGHRTEDETKPAIVFTYENVSNGPSGMAPDHNTRTNDEMLSDYMEDPTLTADQKSQITEKFEGGSGGFGIMATYPDRFLSVTSYKQEYNNWCGVATARIIQRYILGTSDINTPTQYTISKAEGYYRINGVRYYGRLFPDGSNASGAPGTAADCLIAYLNMKQSRNCYVGYTPSSWDEIKQKVDWDLKKYAPFIFTLKSNDTTNWPYKSGGHYTALYSQTYSTATAKFGLADPWYYAGKAPTIPSNAAGYLNIEQSKCKTVHYNNAPDIFY